MPPSCRRKITHLALALTVLTVSLGFVVGVASGYAPVVLEQVLLTRGVDGKPANGSSRGSVISRDTRKNTIVAFESEATNLVRGDTNGRKDIFVIRRRATTSELAPVWRPGSTELASRGVDGKPANGDSWGAVVNGSQQSLPRCVAFVSSASNLVHGDSNGVADAFVYHLRTRKVSRVSISTARRQANGPSFDVSVNGECSKVAFTSSANNLALTRQPPKKYRHRAKYVTGAPRAHHKQIYVRVLHGDTGNTRPLVGMTFLLSVNNRKQPGNGDSYDPDIDIQRYKSAVAFTSTATNLSSGDANSTPDVYLRKIHLLESNHSTRLVSATPGGRAGNGPSSHPAINGDGTQIAFQTDADNLFSDDDNGVTDVVSFEDENRPHSAQGWDRGGRHKISHGPRGWGNGASRKPEVIEEGGWVTFETTANNFTIANDATDQDGDFDVYLWTRKRKSLNNVLASTEVPGTGSNTDPHMSSFGNYIVYTSEPTSGGPAQLWLSYIGPK